MAKTKKKVAPKKKATPKVKKKYGKMANTIRDMD